MEALNFTAEIAPNTEGEKFEGEGQAAADPESSFLKKWIHRVSCLSYNPHSH